MRFLVCSLILAVTAHAAPVERELGDGLIYFRAHTLPADLPPSSAVHGNACVLDLRYATGDADAARVLDAWMKFHAAPRKLLLVIANSGTATDLLAALKSRDTSPGLILVGTPNPECPPDVIVSSSSENERRAYDALEHGMSVAALTTDNPQKARNDEASLTRERTTEKAADEDAAPATPGMAAAAAKAREPLDAALQRAIHIHRGLRALKKI
jgi:ABC-type Fe3+-hydroxamate transport system substrate-binding protein